MIALRIRNKYVHALDMANFYLRVVLASGSQASESRVTARSLGLVLGGNISW